MLHATHAGKCCSRLTAVTASVVPPIAQPAEDPVTTELLDAALELFATLGIKKTTIEDVARKAGVDRVTVYRRLGSKNDVVSAVVAREAQRVFERASATAGKTDDLSERVARVFAGLVGDLRSHALFNRVMTMDPTATFPKVTTEAAELLRFAVQFATSDLLTDIGSQDSEDLTTRVEIVARLIHSLFLTPDAVVALGTHAQRMNFARKYVAPIITG